MIHNFRRDFLSHSDPKHYVTETVYRSIPKTQKIIFHQDILREKLFFLDKSFLGPAIRMWINVRKYEINAAEDDILAVISNI